MSIQQLNYLQQYLTANKLTTTLQTLRRQLNNKIPTKVSEQLLGMMSTNGPPKKENENNQSLSNRRDLDMRKKKTNLLVEGLMGRIAYSSKILEDQKCNQRVRKLMDNKIFMGCLAKKYPQTHQNYQNNSQSNQPKFSLNEDNNSQINQLSFIQNNEADRTLLSQPSCILDQLNKVDEFDEYVDDNDLGYFQFQFNDNELMSGCSQLTKKIWLSWLCCKKVRQKECTSLEKDVKKETKKNSVLTQNSPNPEGFDPLQYNNTFYNSMQIKIIHERQSPFYNNQNQLDFQQGQILAGRYEMQANLGSGVFAKVFKVRDILGKEKGQGNFTCLKMVGNNKDFFDQAFDEIKLLKLIKANYDPDACYLLEFKNVFYHREHLFIEIQLLKDNLFAAYRKNPSFFSLPILKQISKQLLTALSTLHSLKIIHSDLKPQNVLIKSYSPIEIKVIDLGNSCFTHDKLSNYVQSRSYRAPEVILGNVYDQKIDVWSVGCILAQLWTKNVLFSNHCVQGMLARIQSIMGPWPQWMIEQGVEVSKYFSKENLLYTQQENTYHILIPKKTTLTNRIRTDDTLFVNFLSQLLEIDPVKRLSAEEGLLHPFLAN